MSKIQEAIEKLQSAILELSEWYCPKCCEILHPQQVTNTGCCARCGTFIEYEMVSVNQVKEALALLEQAEPEPFRYMEPMKAHPDLPETIDNCAERARVEQAEPDLPAGAEPGELKYCKEHRTIHCSCQQREIDRLNCESKAQAERIKDLAFKNEQLRDTIQRTYESYKNQAKQIEQDIDLVRFRQRPTLKGKPKE